VTVLSKWLKEARGTFKILNSVQSIGISHTEVVLHHDQKVIDHRVYKVPTLNSVLSQLILHFSKVPF